MTASCAEASLGAGEELAGTATQAVRWLLLEWRGAWGREAVGESGLPESARSALESFDGRAVLVRRPDRREGTAVFVVEASEERSEVRRISLDDPADLEGADLASGEVVEGPLVLVCVHGRRDACCARLGVPVFTALARRLGPDRVWQASHLGGHRFAPNVVVLPSGVQLGRIPLERTGEVATAIEEERIPLDLYRGRTFWPPPVQAADAHVRRALGAEGVSDLRLARAEGGAVTFAHAGGETTVTVVGRPGPHLPVSCGAEPEPVTRFVVTP